MSRLCFLTPRTDGDDSQSQWRGAKDDWLKFNIKQTIDLTMGKDSFNSYYYYYYYYLFFFSISNAHYIHLLLTFDALFVGCRFAHPQRCCAFDAIPPIVRRRDVGPHRKQNRTSNVHSMSHRRQKDMKFAWVPLRWAFSSRTQEESRFPESRVMFFRLLLLLSGHIIGLNFVIMLGMVRGPLRTLLIHPPLRQSLQRQKDGSQEARRIMVFVRGHPDQASSSSWCCRICLCLKHNLTSGSIKILSSIASWLPWIK